MQVKLVLPVDFYTMHSTRNIKIQVAFITNSRYLRSAAAVGSTGFFKSIYLFLKLKLEKGVGEVIQTQKTHPHSQNADFI